jgi:hypothetical protein
MPMADAAKLRDRASRLFLIALSARENGHAELADKLTEMASDILEEATTAEVAQQQPQPKKE